VFSQDSISSQANQIGMLESLGLGWKTLMSYNKLKTITPMIFVKRTTMARSCQYDHLIFKANCLGGGEAK
jgi:hypothetical protein